MTTYEARLRDLADVQDLIASLKLPFEFAESLDAWVRDTFHELWNNARTDSSDGSG